MPQRINFERINGINGIIKKVGVKYIKSKAAKNLGCIIHQDSLPDIERSFPHHNLYFGAFQAFKPNVGSRKNGLSLAFLTA